MLLERVTKERKAKSPEQAMAALMRLCARAEKSSGDAMRLMHTWGVEQSEREGVLQKLISQRFIDDARYSGAFVREKTRLSGWGAIKIRAALQRKGVARDVIDTALSENTPDNTAERLATQLARKLKSVKYTSQYDLRAKLIRYGLSLGYEYSIVMDTASQLTKSSDESQDKEFLM